MNKKNISTKPMCLSLGCPCHNGGECRSAIKINKQATKRLNLKPQGVSQWKIEGVRNGYWDYFRDKIYEDIMIGATVSPEFTTEELKKVIRFLKKESNR